jgi:hypothetical protein
MCWEFDVVNSVIKNDLETQKQIISTFEQKWLKIKWFWQPEWRFSDEVLLKQERSDNVPVSGPLLVMMFTLPEF